MKQAYELGKKARSKGFSRTTPYYEERIRVDGKRVDITADLDRAWLAGYDAAPYPEPVTA